MIELLLRALGWILIADGSIALERRSANRKADTGVFQSAVRISSGIQKGFRTREWQVGPWQVEEKRLHMEIWSIPIAGMVAGSRRDATWNERILNGDTVVFTLRTRTATVEFAVLAASASRAIRRLNAPSVPGLATDQDDR